MSGAVGRRSVPIVERPILNPLGFAKHIVWVSAILLIALVPLDWAFPSGTRAIELGVDNAERAVPQLVRGSILFLMLSYIALTGWDPGAYGFIPGRVLFLLAAYMLLSVFFYSSDLISRFLCVVKSLLWVAAAIASYRLTLAGHLSVARIRYLTGAVVIISSAYTIPFCLNPGHRVGQNADASVLLWCIPLLLLARPPLWASGFAGLASIAVIVTVKRGAMLALFVGGLVYSILSICMASRERKMREALLIILVMSTIVGGLVWQWENIEYRMDTEAARGSGSVGGGRAWFYPVIISEWYDGGALMLLFGKGFYTVPETLEAHGRRMYAHSDWLGALHDMGLVGVVLFAYLHYQLIRLLYAFIRQRNPVAPALAMGYCIFALRNIFSQCVIGSSETVYFGLLLGYASALNARRYNRKLWMDG